MRPPLVRSLLRRLPLAAAAAFLAWFGLSEPYGSLLTGTVQLVLRTCEQPAETHLVYENGVLRIVRGDYAGKEMAFDPAPVTATAILFFALVFATPGAGSGRILRRVSAACAALFALHVVHTALSVETLYATGLGDFSGRNYTRFQREALATSRYFLDVVGTYAIPPLLWAVLVLRPALDRDGPERPLRRKKKKG